jgi:hypothetical protein
MIFLQFFLILLGTVFLFYLQRFLGNKLNTILMVLFLALCTFVIAPNWLNRVASIFGIGRGVDLVFYVVLPMLAIFSLRLSIKLKEQKNKTARLVRSLSINRFCEENNIK